MLDTILQQILLLLILAFVITGILLFLFTPAIVSYRRTTTSSGNIITRTTITVKNSDKIHSINKIEQELDTNFQVRENGIVDDGVVVISPRPILSIVIPAYDEEQRLPTMLQSAFTYLNQTTCPTAVDDLISIIDMASPNNYSIDNNSTNQRYDIEWIVVNDGSRDQTSLAYERFIQQHAAVTSSSNSVTKLRMQWKLVSFSKNCGKGAAVQAGMMIATGQFRLMVDADGATDFGPGLSLLIQQLKREMKLLRSEQPTVPPTNDALIQYPIIFGSRAHLHQSPSSSSSSDDAASQQQPQTRSGLRSFLMQAFHVCVLLLVGSGKKNNHRKRRRPPIVDTQCGFKLFPADAAQRLFSVLHLQRWAFDIELVYLLQSVLDYDCIEVVVPWKEIDGSKLHTSPTNLAIVAIGMLRDMICVRLCYTLGIWNINSTPIPTQHEQHGSKKNR